MNGIGNRHGAARVARHAILGPLPPADAISFTFDGATVSARAGEPVIAALLATGVRAFRTMPKTGEPRGGFCMVGRCADCLVVVDGVPNTRACITPVRSGMQVEKQCGLGPAAWLAHRTARVDEDGVGLDETAGPPT